MIVNCALLITSYRLSLDQKGVFAEGFGNMQAKLEERAYTSLSAFSSDLNSVFSNAIGLRLIGDALDVSQSLHNSLEPRNALTAEQKEKKKLARSIVKAIHSSLDDAARKEAELGGRPYEKELLALDALLQENLRSKQDMSSILEAKAVQLDESDNETSNKFALEEDGERQQLPTSIEKSSEDKSKIQLSADMNRIDSHAKAHISEIINKEVSTDMHEGAKNHLRSGNIVGFDHNTEFAKTSRSNEMNGAASGTSGDSSQIGFQQTNNNGKLCVVQEPLTPPSSEKDLSASFANGGIPWYLEPFDPIGTTIHDERWTGREVLRGMSEELSELDDEEVDGLMEIEKKKKKLKKKSVPDWQALTLPLRETRAQKSRKLAAGIT